MKLGLENITALLGRLGDPQHSFPAVLVAGTNGKGSVAAFVSSILRAAGLRIGSCYSPHLFRINERIRLNGEEIPTIELDSILGELRVHHREIPFTFFEGITAAAMLHFARRRVDVAIFEVGLGGRLDATKLVNAAVTVITGISLDHGEHLGSTPRRILREKLGIVREGVPLVANLNSSLLIRSAGKHCATIGAPYVAVGDEVNTRLVSLEPDGMVIDVATPVYRYARCRAKMIGAAQAANAATAVRTVEVLFDAIRHAPSHPTPDGGRVGEGTGARPLRSRSRRLRRLAERRRYPIRSIRAGLAGTSLGGRFQVLPGAPRIVLDVAHNEQALVHSVETLRRISPPKRNVIIFGILAHKQLGTFPRKAAGSARTIICTELRDRRSARSGELTKIFRERGRRGVNLEAVRGMEHAVKTALSGLGANDTLLILGSHLAVEEAAAFL
jgi:dihydrofolate synthase/folylpolyglutamate synthase